MLENVQKKLMNGYILADLPKMAHSIPKNFSKVMQLQNERVRKLAECAYRIDFYKEHILVDPEVGDEEIKRVLEISNKFNTGKGLDFMYFTFQSLFLSYFQFLVQF